MIVNVSIDDRWKGFVEGLLKSGRYGSANDVVRDGLRLVEERETRLEALRDRLIDSVERGGAHSADDVDAAVKARLDQWEQQSKAG